MNGLGEKLKYDVIGVGVQYAAVAHNLLSRLWLAGHCVVNVAHSFLKSNVQDFFRVTFLAEHKCSTDECLNEKQKSARRILDSQNQ